MANWDPEVFNNIQQVGRPTDLTAEALLAKSQKVRANGKFSRLTKDKELLET